MEESGVGWKRVRLDGREYDEMDDSVVSRKRVMWRGREGRE